MALGGEAELSKAELSKADLSKADLAAGVLVSTMNVVVPPPLPAAKTARRRSTSDPPNACGQMSQNPPGPTPAKAMPAKASATSPDTPGKPARRWRGPVTLASLVPDTIEPALRQRGFATAAILTEWAEIVGPRLAGWTQPLEIRWPRRPEVESANGKPLTDKAERARRATLVLACPGAFALEVQMASAGLIEAVNRRLGFGCIGSIVVQQLPRLPTPKPPRSRQLDPAAIEAVSETLTAIEAPDLRRALAELGAGIAAKAAETATVPAQKRR